MPDLSLDIERRVAISLAVGRYLRSADRFNEASREFTGACKSLRKQLGTGQRFVVQVDFKHYLVTSDRDGNFDVEHIQSL
ncbi:MULTISPECIES: hypothetical protein [Pirellulaceae]|uniref:Uncharacterized protein n=1 Tax=Aporhodopirellula rubra TaxID=980271 RepID=A0A7W5DXU9_9BACT|nr:MULTISPECIES: hypothetical protein [Pirellulaceae]MBB3205577.1 hypothetical protein [Aporhodopirellula rubra]MDV6033226.1 hypothetical protein [Phycisphaera sp. RhM]